MRRNKPIPPTTYLETRISQLREDAAKANDSYDVMWYNKMIQELLWLKQVIDRKEK
jgi:hypothetical protein